ncbi:MAG: WG repeat-containing protein [Saprospiraceae bacterium]|nr:WG repeat-containing protein [Saprospiraceae bacterium]
MKWIIVFLILSWGILDVAAQRNSQQKEDLNLSQRYDAQLRKQYSHHKPYKNSFAIVRDKNCKIGVVDHQAKEIIPCVYDQIEQLGKDLFRAKKNNQVEYYWGSQVLPLGQHYGAVKGMGNNVMAVEVDKRWGLVTTQGKGIALMQYLEIESFSEIEETYIKVKKGGKWGLLDYEGKSILPTMYDDILPIYSNSFAVKQNGQYELITRGTKGKPKVYYQNIKLLNEYGSKLAFEKDGLWGLLELNAESEVITLLEPKYKEIKQVGNVEVAIKVEEGWQLWNHSENNLQEEVYKDILGAPKDEVLAVQKKDDSWTLQNVDFNSDDPTEFTSVQCLTDAYWRLETKEQVFFMNAENNFQLISFEYEKVDYLGDHFFLVNKDGLEAVMDNANNMIFKFSDQKIESYDQGLFKVRRENQVLLLDRQGRVVNCD